MKSAVTNRRGDEYRFDDTEFIHCPTPEQAALLDSAHGVDCFGKLEIKSLDWLTESGYKKLQKAVLDFDDKAHTEFSRVLKVEGFDLQSWLNNCPMVLEGDRMVKRKLKVWIMFRKKLPARFLTGKLRFFLVRHHLTGVHSAQRPRRFLGPI